VRQTLRVNNVPAPQNSVQLNQWQHFRSSFVRQRRFYKKASPRSPVPGALGAASANVLTLATPPTRSLSISLFAGAMDEIAIWERPLSEAKNPGLADRDITGRR